MYILVSRKGKHVFQEKSTAMTSSSPGIVHPFFFTSSNDEDDEGEEDDSSDSQHLLSYLLVCLWGRGMIDGLRLSRVKV